MNFSSAAMIWQLANKNLGLKPGDVHLWRAHLPSFNHSLDAYYQILSKEEKDRAARFKFTEHQQRFIIAKAVLRNILGRYLSMPPEDIKFIYGQHGKPSLDPIVYSRQAIQFNQSDSQDFAIYGFTLQHDIGIDIEYTQRNGISREEIAHRFFSAAEYESLMHQPEDQRDEVFYRLWTCKEAFLKAIGMGLAFPLQNFDINVSLPFPQLMRISDAALANETWQIRTLNIADHYVAAYAVKDTIKEVYHYSY